MSPSAHTKINLACGSVFVTGDGWINLDYSSTSPAVQRADLLGRLDLPNDHAALVYSSHFLEHIPRHQVKNFLTECWRVLAPGGVLRLVLPDLENLCRTYLWHRERGEHDKADFLNAERQLRRRWRTSPLVVGLCTIASRTATGWLRGVDQSLRGLPVPTAGSRYRRPSTQGYRVDVHRGEQTRLGRGSTAGFLWGGWHD